MMFIMADYYALASMDDYLATNCVHYPCEIVIVSDMRPTEEPHDDFSQKVWLELAN
jgi:hypothetical protein